jgi:alpha-tubulin suppressor-like RCC1 family protein
MQIKHIYAFGKRMIIQKKNIENKEFLYLGGIDFSGFELEQFQPLKFFLQNNEKIFLDKKIKSISLGVNHCIILDNENNLYGIGDNTYGELGNSNVNIDYFSLLDKNNLESIWLKNTDPKKNLKKKDFQIKKVVCGSRHTLI